MVNSYKFLGVHLNNKLDWTDNTEPAVVPEEAQVLQHEAAADVLPVCGGQWALLCRGVLGWKHQHKGPCQAEQACEEG